MQTKSLFPLFLGLLLQIMIGSVTLSAADKKYIITVSAGGFDRSESVVDFIFPDEVDAGTYLMQDQNGNTIPVQVDSQNKGWFILKNLEAGESRRYKMSRDSYSKKDESGVHYSFHSNTIAFKKQDQTVLSYYYKDNNPPEELDSRYKRAGYIHPLFSPEGVPLTNHLDTSAHPHHSGVWTAWTKTEFQGRSPDFWNPHNNSGRVDHVDSVDVVWNGPVFGGLKAKNQFVDISGPAPVAAVNEEWQLRIFNNSLESGYHIIDLTITHTTNTEQPLILPEYHYGGAAFRGHQHWNDPENVSFLTSEGYDRKLSEGTRARWTLAEGKIGNEYAGVAMLGHPSNFRAPQPIHIHNSTPYFVYVPMKLGEFSIDPGSPFVMRYRLITYDGEADTGLINRLWNDYAYPPGVTVAVE